VVKDFFKKLLTSRSLLFISFSISIIGLLQVLSTYLILQNVPFEFMSEDLSGNVPLEHIFTPLLFWNIPLFLVLIYKLLSD
jgi:hypothetical protein